MLVAFNKIDLPGRRARPGRRSERAARGRGPRRSSPSPRRPGEGLDAFRARIAATAARRRGARRAARAGRRRRPPDRGDGRRVQRRARGGRRRSASAASGSSGSPPRPTSTSRSRPSASSATWPGSASTPSCGGPGSRRATWSGSAASELEWEAAALGGRVTDRPAPIVPGRSASSAGRSTRSTSPTSRSPRRPREALGLERVLFIPAGQPPHKPGRQITAGGRPPGDGRAGDRGQPGVRGRAGSRSTGPARRTPSTRSRPCARGGGRGAGDLDADPVGRGVRSACRPGTSRGASSSSRGSWSRRATATRTPTPAFARRALPGAPAADRLPGRAAAAALGVGAARAGGGRPVAALPRPGCGRGATSATMGSTGDRQEDASIVTEPALQTTRATAPQRRRPAAARHRGRRHGASAPPLDLARRIVELAEDKKAADIVLLDLAAADDAGRLLRHLLGRLGAAARRDRRRDHRRPARREGQADRPRGHAGVALGPASTSGRSSSTSSRRPSATTTASRSTGPRRRRSCGSSRRANGRGGHSSPDAVRMAVPSGHADGYGRTA